jgi:hypothetical protein
MSPSSTPAKEILREVDPVEHLAQFNPVPNGDYCTLDCPCCGANGRAYWYRGSYSIRCNRQNECGAQTSVLGLLAGTVTDKLPYPGFKRALAEAAALVGVEIPAIDKQELQRLEQAHNRQSALSYAQRLAQRELLRKNDKANNSRQYLTGRGLLTAHIKDLELGLVTARTCKAVAAKYGSKLLNNLGLNNLTGYVTSLGLDLHGNPLALHGRLPTHADNNRREKMSTRGSGIKSVPFRLFEAVQKGKKQVVLVEGLFDALLCHAYGEPRAVAVMRNSVSKAQALALKQAGVSAAAICFDQDDAGKEHILTAISQLSARGIRAFVVPSLAGSAQ